MSDGAIDRERLAAAGAALRDAVHRVLHSLELESFTSRSIRDALGTDNSAARRLIRLSNEADDVRALTRAPKPAALKRFAAQSKTKGVDPEEVAAVYTAVAEFEALIGEAGSKADLTRLIRDAEEAP